MTNDEIRALVDKMEQFAPILQQGGQLSAGYMLDKARTAIETLLAREEEVLKALAVEESGENHDFHPCNLICRQIRAILYPQPAAPAKEKTNG